ncbi:hypothetical protein [Sinorhizobium mexicanum]|uniref:hypothetical protein n=1 Tax=Sinorhizobium mexicanum TaxID=375549 RepID=UPI001DC6532B|nr:hypothetical protein [Sinorhizobium mexicanum]MBP1886416.1 hypothetical protein [Sinorhizobium mexicanum]
MKIVVIGGAGLIGSKTVAGTPYTIIRSTQSLEFLGSIADVSMEASPLLPRAQFNLSRTTLLSSSAKRRSLIRGAGSSCLGHLDLEEWLRLAHHRHHLRRLGPMSGPVSAQDRKEEIIEKKFAAAIPNSPVNR